VPGSAHSFCAHPVVGANDDPFSKEGSSNNLLAAIDCLMLG
jgi:hypothetical protein